MIEIGKRTRNQPAPPHVVFEALIDPDRDPARPWLDLLDDEIRPRVVGADPPSMVLWSSLWLKRPDALLRLDLVHVRAIAGVPGPRRAVLARRS